MEVASPSTQMNSLVVAYVNGTIKSKDIPMIESKIGENENLKDLYLKKVQEQEFLMALIPDISSSKNSLLNLKIEIAQITEEVFPEEKKSLLKSVEKFLNKPVVTIKY
jgi:hypothetical protein